MFVLTRPDGETCQIACRREGQQIAIDLEGLPGEIALHLRDVSAKASAIVGNHVLVLEPHGHAQIYRIPAGDVARRTLVSSPVSEIILKNFATHVPPDTR